MLKIYKEPPQINKTTKQNRQRIAENIWKYAQPHHQSYPLSHIQVIYPRQHFISFGRTKISKSGDPEHWWDHRTAGFGYPAPSMGTQRGGIWEERRCSYLTVPRQGCPSDLQLEGICISPMWTAGILAAALFITGGKRKRDMKFRQVRKRKG